jgi:tryptophan 2,3-dioxygenase
MVSYISPTLDTAINAVHQQTGFDSAKQSRIEFMLARENNIDGLRKSYCKLVKAFKCVQDHEAKKRAVLTINNLKASD